MWEPCVAESTGAYFCFYLFSVLCASLLWVSLGRDLGKTAESVAALGRGDVASSSLHTFTGRLPLWEEELGYVRTRPVLGYGYNAFLDPRNISAVSQAIGWVPGSAHSGYIGTLLDLGYVGAATFALVLTLGLKRSVSLARNARMLRLPLPS